MTHFEQTADIPDAAEILRSIGDAAYEWRLDTDALTWSDNAAAVLGIADIPLSDVLKELESRTGRSGIAEKASRPQG